MQIKNKIGTILLFFLLLSPVFVGADEGKNVVVERTQKGFFPQKVELVEGGTVVFENKDRKAMWPASNIHPTHDIYPEFDPKKPIESGKRWSFTFKRVGTWVYHDHIDPLMTGMVVVKEDKDKTQREVRKLEKETQKKNPFSLRDRFNIWTAKLRIAIVPGEEQKLLGRLDVREVAGQERELKIWLAVLGPKKLLMDLLNDTGGGSLGDCHQEAHKIGRTAYELFGSRAFREGDASCHSGFYHGAMEAFLKEQGTDTLSSKITALCNSFETSFGIFECLHGIGHGLMAYESYDMPEALELCEKLNNPFETNSCYGGVFMENVVAGQGSGALTGHKTKWVNKDPHFPCNAPEVKNNADREFQCYQMQTSWMLTLSDYNFDTVIAECQKSSSDMIDVCYRSIGRDIAGHTLRKTDKILALCAKVPHMENYYEECLQGALNVIVDFWGEGLRDQATELCRNVEAPYKQNCYETLAVRVQNIFINKEKQEAVCATFEKEYKSLCKAS